MGKLGSTILSDGVWQGSSFISMTSLTVTVTHSLIITQDKEGCNRNTKGQVSRTALCSVIPSTTSLSPHISDKENKVHKMYELVC